MSAEARASGGLGSGLDDDHTQRRPLFHPPQANGTELDAEIVTEIEADLSALQTELQHAARLAQQRNDPFWIDAAETLRERERRVVELWRNWQRENEEQKQPNKEDR